jgi:hypothetical protein
MRHPPAVAVSIITAVRINSFFMNGISHRNILVPSCGYRHVNSTSLPMMCKRNLGFFGSAAFSFLPHGAPI